jgi:hypothetical protein
LGPSIAFLLCIILFAIVSKAAAFLLLFLLSFTGQRVSRIDTQLPILWLTSLRQKGSHDPLKHNCVADKGTLYRDAMREKA